MDDDPKFTRTLGDILRARGFAVTQITDPHGVVERLEADGQTVLLDMKLNDIGGLEVLEVYRVKTSSWKQRSWLWPTSWRPWPLSDLTDRLAVWIRPWRKSHRIGASFMMLRR